jgi:SpoVK/Ycf46/Vps4 family AAA+-type ATPase
MEIKISEELATAIGQKELKPFKIDLNDYRWKSSTGTKVDLSQYSPMKIMELKSLINDNLGLKGARVAIRDIDAWLTALKDKDGAHPRNVQHFFHMVKKFMVGVTGQRVYLKTTDNWYGYYVSHAKYEPEVKRRDYKSPAYVQLTLHYREFGTVKKTSVSFFMRDVANKTVFEALTAKGYIPETEEHRKLYLAEHAKFLEHGNKVGRQFLAVGTATDDLDGNVDKDQDRRRGWWWSRTNTITLDKYGEPSRVVIDLFKEDEKTSDADEDDDDDEYMDGSFWVTEGAKKPNRDTGTIDEMDTEEAVDDAQTQSTAQLEAEVPTHPTVAVFDLRRHLRLRLHIGQLTLYEYDPKMGEKLVLPAEQRVLIDILLAQKDGGFRDIIVGKGGGAVILCAGPPGTGKTLTAECYAEVTSRPLYTVQCSQLGTDEIQLEDNLLKVFARSQRWNAILLLDEADVYVAQRGNDLTQNAIVGVFLRTLEYYRGTMFMTTNRADLVDDAVASRCIARITYKIPDEADQKRIWRILADVAGAKITDGVIKGIAHSNPGLSGRDVKNLLKLSMLMSAARDEPITEKLVKEVKIFKPTQEVKND